ncbi:translocation protein [Anaeromyces robustus]|uniref:Translocation protein SEC62 n=1 Tax=Anaeromyces robustus TaxID=1754192 RepID=A0A1Y1X1B5_9FUNG|nr:translocation protein [Anaeromyces robustus]|eukprot:ORX79589.1 translocation protein [Anaeromyces robustus]
MSSPDFSKVPKDVMEVAKYLLSSDSKMRTRSGVLNGRRVEYFKGKAATHALLRKAYSKSKKRPTIDNREKAAEYMKELVDNGLILRVNHTPHSKQCSFNQIQDYNDDFYYIWIYEGSQLKTLLLGFGILLIVLAGVMFQVWPLKLRRGAYYILVALMWFMVAFFIMVIFRFILYLISLVVCKRSIWLFPNLFADVGIIESFQPVWGYGDEEAEKMKPDSSQESLSTSEVDLKSD